MGHTRRPVAGAWRRLVGPLGPVRSGLVLGTAAAGGALVARATARRSGPLRAAVLGAVAVDLVGGLVSFQLGPTRERYAAEPVPARLAFVAAHLQPFVLPLTGQGSWRRAAARYGVAVASTAVLEVTLARSPARRPVAVLVAVAASAVDVATDRSDQRWFGPVLLVKLVGGHGGIPRRA